MIFNNEIIPVGGEGQGDYTKELGGRAIILIEN